MWGMAGPIDLEQTGRAMTAHEQRVLLEALQTRFEKNVPRHTGVAWADVRAKLERNPDALRSLGQMEATGGEPDVIGHDTGTGQYTF